MSRYAALVKGFRDAVLGTPAALSPATRQAAFDGADVAPEVAAYLAKVRQHAYKVTDEDVAHLRAAGWDEARIYELTVATAVGQGMRRLDAGLAALRGTPAGGTPTKGSR